MTHWENLRAKSVIIALASAAFAPQSLVLGEQQPQTLEVQSGHVSFHVGTNVPGVSIHGKSKAMEGRVRLQRASEGLVLQQIEVVLDPETLRTGMGLRDDHMRKYVFTTPDGETPEVRFTADNIVCPNSVSGSEFGCQVSGNLTIRGISKPFSMPLEIRETGGQHFRAKGDSQVRLSEYGIPAPSQLGVKTADEVNLEVEFTARTTTSTTADSRRR